jgi:F-type H+-transporting ATPase subunit delta
VSPGKFRDLDVEPGRLGIQDALARSATPDSGIAARYALSLFELALEEGALSEVETDLERFDALIRGSEDLRRLLRSPVFSGEEQLGAVSAVLGRAGIGGLVANFVRVVARNHRLFAMIDMLGQFRKLLAEHRGEEAADVTVAHRMTDDQASQLKSALKAAIGKEVAINEIVDPTILGGLVVKVGSRQIDTSLRTKLSSLKLALKEVG